MFYCDALSDTRTRLLCDFMDSMPGAMKNTFCDLPSKSKLEFIISGLGSGRMMNTARAIVSVISPTDPSARPALSSAFGLVWLLTCGKMKITTRPTLVTRTDSKIH